ncbi:SAM-dependent methyltransferase [Paenibacillus pinisoli]|uniref:S-adenosyl-L-methionine-dependent methyltransferase n=1 Tax=Paenibacillus pinisoli TaxID=1276110 RepID=A0A3A6PDZ8_9BACL|nr:class I SAM-dependent methyltransferase [Paenibacillus pinisoli]RJX39832.1 SAM-dependent methyltransferase [Paenibacillus pinisoli]
MEKQSLTALVSAFARAYHAEHKEVKVFDDPLARLLISDEEFAGISGNMAKAAAFFRPGLSGSPEEALREVVDHQLSPTPLGRAAFTEEALEAAVRLGARQYLIFAAGYDTFAYRQPAWAAPLQIFEIDHPATSADKQRRIAALPIAMPENLHFIAADFREPDWRSRLLDCPAFDPPCISFCSLLGISYYLTKEVFRQLLSDIASMLPRGSSIVFDYPDELTFTDQAGQRAKKQVMMAAQAGEPMEASYSYAELERMLEEADLLIYKHLTPEEITDQVFHAYNNSQPDHPVTAFDHVHYVLAVKQ